LDKKYIQRKLCAVLDDFIWSTLFTQVYVRLEGLDVPLNEKERNRDF